MPLKSSTYKPDGFRTVISPASAEYRLTYGKGIMLIGSCFTENIGNYLARYKFSADQNPFGIVYNPLSIAAQIRRLVENTPYKAEDLVFRDDLWHSFDHHGRFSDVNQELCLNRINSRLEQSASFIRHAGHLILTFGTPRVYNRKSSGEPVANCHKFPEADFSSKLYEPEEILEKLIQVIDLLRNINPDIRLVWSVSPVRYLKEGAPGNQLSKSILIRMIVRLLETYPESYYFPAYEIFMDDLRDYRYYATDLVHPGEAGIDYVWERFKESCIDPDSIELMNRLEPVIKAARHRQSGEITMARKEFYISQLEKISKLKEEFPFLNFDPEIKAFSSARQS
ncbi:MAG: GSCFA domain-containing protein [Bacteroidota bacterium]